MPERSGKWHTVSSWYRRWTRQGLFDRILRHLHIALDQDGRIDWSEFDVDGMNIRAHQSAAGAVKTRANDDLTTTPWGDRAAALEQSFIL